MKILLVSAFPEHHPAIKPGQYLQKTGQGLRSALERAGHTVEAFDYRAVEHANRHLERSEHRRRKWLRLLKRPWLPEMLHRPFFRIPGIRTMNRLLLERAATTSPDLIILTKAELVAYDTARRLTELAPTWYFFMDPVEKAHRHCIGHYGRACTWASATRTKVVAYLERQGARQAVFLTQGADTEHFHPDATTPPLHDVVFVGTVNAWRRRYVEYCTAAGLRVATYGRNGDHPFIAGAELGTLYRGTRIVLDFNNTGGNTGFSLRVFEVLGSGAFLLSEFSRDTARIFDIGRELVCFRTPEELVALVRKYLPDEAGRRAIAQAGAARVARDYTWDAVARRITAAAAAR
jgi:hypothetical protein